VYFPTTILPRPVQLLADIVPATWAFNGIHNALNGSGPTLQFELISLAMSVASLAVGILLLRDLYQRSKVSGQFARNDA
jgi:ABC-type multidrug transport system permease subunit